MSGQATFRVQGWFWVGAFTFAYFALALAALELAKQSNGLTFVWPASGVAVAGLLLLKPLSRPSFLLAVAFASIVANLLFGTPPGTAMGFSVANIVECLVAHRIAGNGTSGSDAFSDPGWVARFAAGAAIAAVASATMAALAAGGVVADATFVVSWGSTVFLGILIVTPAIVTLRWAMIGSKRPTLERPLAIKVGVYLVVATLTVATFGQSHYPLLFLPLAAVVLATYSLGIAGAVVTVLLVAVVGSTVTAHGGGPIHFIAKQQERIVFLQFYLAVLLASALPLASLLARSRASAALLRQSNRLLQTAERTAHVGHWRYEIGAKLVFWSHEVFRIHGREPGTSFVTASEGIMAYHPADRPTVRIGLQILLRTGDPFAFDGRIIQPNGKVRHVETYAEVEHDEFGSPIALIGVVVDVTAKVEAIEQLEAAKMKAEREAERTTTLSETDELTGIANRRKLMEVLKHQVTFRDPGHRSMAFVMFDLDNFKLINDRFGHGVGDLVLRAVAEAASACLRDTDLIGRMGGEEFGVVLPAADRDVAVAVADRMRTAVERCWGGQFGLEKVTASFGVAVLDRWSRETDVLQIADQALYSAKRDGKNRIRLASASARRTG